MKICIIERAAAAERDGDEVELDNLGHCLLRQYIGADPGALGSPRWARPATRGWWWTGSKPWWTATR